ncbi:nickel ABC transporter substrate-binding protein [Paenibacillus senegalimassiliensis]|uniref:nickel ABC transporter substrate-binding protein n=1 Tax=Paenibacillus senegalimassiliensis TaxID=1737426 RepID=UPI00073F5D87|nr:nickel ABC transporter substrate-binding protein [Paenibacillus senegalimassiliensis]
MKTKWLAGLIALLILVAGCGQQAKQTTQASGEKKNELVFASTKDIRDINPHLTGGELAAQNMVFESLVVNTPEGVQPKLAESWDISEDGLTYTFKLRENVVFNDGEPFNAEAVKQNIDAVVANYEKNAWLNLVQVIGSTAVVDEHTFVLTLKNPYYPTLEELGLTRPFRMISPNSFIDGTTANGVNGYAGTGPYQLAEHKDNQYALFTINEHYWGDKPKIGQVRWKVMPDHQTILLALQNGEIDLIFGADGDMLDANAFTSLQEQGKYITKISPPSGSRSILLNSKREFTQDKLIREALQYAINKQTIATGILNGTEQIADVLMSKSTPYADIELTARPYDVAKAEALLDQAGWVKSEDGYRYQEGKKLSLMLSYNSDNAQEKTIGESMQNDLKAIGVELELLGEEKQAYFDRQKSGEFDLQYSLSWGLPYDPQTYVSTWRVPSHGDYQAQAGLEKKEWLDQTIGEVLVEQDEAARADKYEQIFSYVHEEAVYLPLTYSVVKAIHSEALHGVTFNVSQYEIPFELMYFE